MVLIHMFRSKPRLALCSNCGSVTTDCQCATVVFSYPWGVGMTHDPNRSTIRVLTRDSVGIQKRTKHQDFRWSLMQFIQFICRWISAIKQSTFLRCSCAYCRRVSLFHPCPILWQVQMTSQAESKLSTCWKYKALSLWYIHLSEKINSRAELRKPKKMIHQKGKSGYQTLAFLATVQILVGLVCHLAPRKVPINRWILHGLKVRNTPRISKDHVPHDHGVRTYESHWVIHPSEDICHNKSAQMQLDLSHQVLSHLAKYHELKNHVVPKERCKRAAAGATPNSSGRSCLSFHKSFPE